MHRPGLARLSERVQESSRRLRLRRDRRVAAVRPQPKTVPGDLERVSIQHAIAPRPETAGSDLAFSQSQERFVLREALARRLRFALLPPKHAGVKGLLGER